MIAEAHGTEAETGPKRHEDEMVGEDAFHDNDFVHSLSWFDKLCRGAFKTNRDAHDDGGRRELGLYPT